MSEYHAPDLHRILVNVLSRFPERVWLPIIAEHCLPLLKHRKSDVLNELLDAFLDGPRADFRHLETGAAKPEAETDLADSTRREILRHAYSMLSASSLMKRLAQDAHAAGDVDSMLKKAHEQTRMLRDTKLADLTDAQFDPVEELFREIEPARSYEEGQTRSEINLFISAAYDHVMQSSMPGRPQGFYLRAMLSTRPPGFSVPNLTDYPKRIVWPYLASHFDILDRAMGLSEPFYFEPRYERRKAIELIALLPKTPARYADVLFEVATGPHAGGRETSQRLLAGATGYTERAIARLSHKKAEIRVAAAATLKSIGDPTALPVLRDRARSDRSKAAKLAIDDAILALTKATRQRKGRE